MGKGPTLGWGPNIHPALFKKFKELAESLEIPYTLEVMARHSGTDAYAIQVAAEGIPSTYASTESTSSLLRTARSTRASCWAFPRAC